MAKSKINAGQLLTVGAALAGLYVAYKTLPGLVKSASGGSASGGGSSPLASLKKPLAAKQEVPPAKPSASGSPMPNTSAAGSAAKAIAGLSPVESISQALRNGDYTGANQNVLAGIFNLQNGYQYDGGGTLAQQGQSLLDGGAGLDSAFVNDFGSYQIPYQDAGATLNMTGTSIGGDSSGYYGGGDTGGWNELNYNSPYDSGSYYDSSSYDGGYAGGYDTSGGYYGDGYSGASYDYNSPQYYDAQSFDGGGYSL